MPFLLLAATTAFHQGAVTHFKLQTLGDALEISAAPVIQFTHPFSMTEKAADNVELQYRFPAELEGRYRAALTKHSARVWIDYDYIGRKTSFARIRVERLVDMQRRVADLVKSANTTNQGYISQLAAEEILANTRNLLSISVSGSNSELTGKALETLDVKSIFVFESINFDNADEDLLKKVSEWLKPHVDVVQQTTTNTMTDVSTKKYKIKGSGIIYTAKVDGQAEHEKKITKIIGAETVATDNILQSSEIKVARLKNNFADVLTKIALDFEIAASPDKTIRGLGAAINLVDSIEKFDLADYENGNGELDAAGQLATSVVGVVPIGSLVCSFLASSNAPPGYVFADGTKRWKDILTGASLALIPAHLREANIPNMDKALPFGTNYNSGDNGIRTPRTDVWARMERTYLGSEKPVIHYENPYWPNTSISGDTVYLSPAPPQFAIPRFTMRGQRPQSGPGPRLASGIIFDMQSERGLPVRYSKRDKAKQREIESTLPIAVFYRDTISGSSWEARSQPEVHSVSAVVGCRYLIRVR